MIFESHSGEVVHWPGASATPLSTALSHAPGAEHAPDIGKAAPMRFHRIERGGGTRRLCELEDEQRTGSAGGQGLLDGGMVEVAGLDRLAPDAALRPVPMDCMMRGHKGARRR
jgi:hypothetical protein